jgi:5-bromo-4-chloroindolyl phosphate hydrolysis protein
MIARNEILKETGLTEKDLRELREKFVEKYVKEKGWEKSKLTMEQLNEIYQQDEYRRPGLLLS